MNTKKEFGDFQTPESLAKEMTAILKAKGYTPSVVVEPTCGLGSILLAVNEALNPTRALGIEIQGHYVEILSEKIQPNTVLLNQDFFKSTNSIKEFVKDYQNILFVGNPPWVTNSELSAHLSTNLPQKSNFDNIKGIEAITGKSNFDISEYIIRELISNFSDKKAVFAFLCKIGVAKKIVGKLWKANSTYKSAEIYPIDAEKYFNASVDACFFLLDCTDKNVKTELMVYDAIESKNPSYTSGYVRGVYLENIKNSACLDIYGKSPFVWRNGIKHDCARVMEFRISDDKLYNGYGEIVDIEDDLLFPYLKSSDIANGKVKPSKRILATQRFVNEPTFFIEKSYPKTWKYLNQHRADFEKRKSIIYKNKPDFSIFSVGDYTFKPYKIAISGLYKSIHFQFIEPFKEKSVLLDDTCNFISFDDKDKATFVFKLLNSDFVSDYLNSRVSWEAKRPIKTEVLNSIDLEKVAKKLNLQNAYLEIFGIDEPLLLFA